MLSDDGVNVNDFSRDIDLGNELQMLMLRRNGVLSALCQGQG